MRYVVIRPIDLQKTGIYHELTLSKERTHFATRLEADNKKLPLYTVAKLSILKTPLQTQLVITFPAQFDIVGELPVHKKALAYAISKQKLK